VVFNALCFFRSSILMATLSLTDWTMRWTLIRVHPMVFPLAALLAQLGEDLAWHKIMLSQAHFIHQ
jgi:hypothetical protein